jgi:hypothetical protein
LGPTKDHDPSDIRIYCDNDVRWVNIDEDNKLPEGSIKWADPINFMGYRKQPRCQTNTPGQTPIIGGSTYNIPFNVEGHGQAEDRSVFSLCDALFGDSNDLTLMALTDHHLNDGVLYDPEGLLTMADVTAVIAATVLHETTHTNTWSSKYIGVSTFKLTLLTESSAVDVRGDNSYGWDACKAMAGTEDAVTNADSYTQFGTFSTSSLYLSISFLTSDRFSIRCGSAKVHS